MPTGESFSLQPEKTLAPPMRYRPVRKSNFVLPLKELSIDEACIVPDFELAEEELIARGADSAHIAISPPDSTENQYLGIPKCRLVNSSSPPHRSISNNRLS